ncbi:MAG: ROK family protein [Calditrichae bacterium]|nr:ROK family protein [Calditrichota bacterium]MCB9059016.1 ROK family protein [Calditrichia bacterium]
MEKTSYGRSQSRLRQHNINVVIAKIKQDQPITKREIATKTGLSFAKVNSISITLTNLGLINEIGKAESGGGRPSAIYQINPNFGYTIGCELSHKKISTIIVDLNGKIHSKNSVKFDIQEGKESLLLKILDSIHIEIDKSDKIKQKIIGIGIAVAGLVNPQNGMSTPFPHLVNWGDIPLKKIIEDEFGLFCYVENVANSAALAELNYGVKKNADNILAVNVGSGLGLGIVLNRSLYIGATGSAGEFGHITVDENGPLCMCGNVGCLETMASTTSVVNRAKSMLDKQVVSSLLTMSDNDIDRIDFKMICESALQGDKLSFNLLDEMGRNLGEGIVTLINLLNPQMIIIGGEIFCAKDILLQPILTVVQKRALEIPRKKAEVMFSALGSNAGLMGAVIPVMEHFYSALPKQISTETD